MQDAAGAILWRARALPPLRARLLAHWTTGGATLGPRGRWLFAGLSRALDREYYAPGTPTARREAIKALCMGEDSGVRWARHYLERGFPDRYTPVLGMFAELEARLASGAVARVHQVACCSGREIAYFARRFPHVAFTGSDTDEAIVAFLRETWGDVPNLAFTRLRLEETEVTEMETLRGDLVYASGGLHYMDRASLRRFFGRARGLARILLLSQPLDRGYRVAEDTESRPRRQLSWNHPYPHDLREAGWTRVTWSEGFAEELPEVKNVSVVAEAG